METEEIESKYEQSVTGANEFFINGLKKKEDKKRLEKSYKEKLDKTREEYYKNIRKYLSEHRYKKEEKKPKKEEKNKRKLYNYKKNVIDEINYTIKIKIFEFEIMTKQIRDLGSINHLLFNMKRIKIIFRHEYSNFRNKLLQIYANIKESLTKFIEHTLSKIRVVLKKITETYNLIFEKIKNLIKKKPKEPVAN